MTETVEPPTKRPYNSPLRTRRKHENRARVISSVIRLASTRPLDAITMDAIARLSRVSPETVHIIGTKRALFHEAVATVLDDVVHDVDEETLAGVLTTRQAGDVASWLAATLADWNDTSAGLWTSAASQALVDADLASLLSSTRARRRASLAVVARRFAPDDVDAVVSRLLVDLSPETHWQLRGHVDEHADTWAVRAIRQALDLT